MTPLLLLLPRLQPGVQILGTSLAKPTSDPPGSGAASPPVPDAQAQPLATGDGGTRASQAQPGEGLSGTTAKKKGKRRKEDRKGGGGEKRGGGRRGGTHGARLVPQSQSLEAAPEWTGPQCQESNTKGSGRVSGRCRAPGPEAPLWTWVLPAPGVLRGNLARRDQATEPTARRAGPQLD